MAGCKLMQAPAGGGGGVLLNDFATANRRCGRTGAPSLQPSDHGPFVRAIMREVERMDPTRLPHPIDASNALFEP
jgi:hypothetical protein